MLVFPLTHPIILPMRQLHWCPALRFTLQVLHDMLGQYIGRAQQQGATRTKNKGVCQKNWHTLSLYIYQQKLLAAYRNAAL
jgi:hypothetical protein